MSARVAPLVLLLVAGGCLRAPEAVLLVNVDVPAALGLDQLAFSLSGADERGAAVLPDPPAPLAGTQSAAFQLPPALIGVEVAVAVEGLAAGVIVARGGGVVTPGAEQVTTLAIALAPLCGDGVFDDGEVCDDGNDQAGDGCGDCAVEPGFTCAGTPSACAAICADSLVRGAETCDDGNTADGDGCAAACSEELGYACSGEPSSCATVCGDGIIAGAEVCDDLDVADGDGCSALCAQEPGFVCSGEPSTCTTVCGDSIVAGLEQCDDGSGNADVPDACRTTCLLPACGDQLVDTGEQCDDGTANGTGADQCRTGSCALPYCGDQIVDTGEQCDDGAANGTGANQCKAGTCVAPFCGDGLADTGEQCDDGTGNGNGADQCKTGTCVLPFCGDAVADSGEECDDGANGNNPGQCRATCDLPFCGDTIVDTAEQCDDANLVNTDACITGCVAPTCGDGFVTAPETCDDGNAASADGCSSGCLVEGGFLCRGLPSTCRPSAQVRLVGAGQTYSTIAAAVGAAASGDALFLSAQTFNEELDLSTKNLTIVGATGAIITNGANGNGRDTLEIFGGRTVVLRNLTIRHTGSGNSPVLVRGAGTSVTIEGCTLGPSGSVGLDATAGTTIALRRSRVTQNTNGGLVLSGTWTVENTVLFRNGDAAASVGGASFGSAGTFRFNTVAENTASAVPGGVVCAVATALTSSIVYGNTGAGQASGACNGSTSLVDLDPTFAADGFHVLATSRALDAAPLAACPALDLDGETREMDALCDIGADERPRDPP